jgi:hypothetical protein
MFRGKAGWTSAAAVLVAAGVLTGTMLAAAAGPALPKRTPAQLLVAMRNARPPAAMTAVISESANLGFPSLPNIAGLNATVFSAASWITGTHTVDIWYDGPRHVRIAVPVSFGETDLRVDGNQVWLWDSHGQTATRLIVPARPEILPNRSAWRALPGHPVPRLLTPQCRKQMLALRRAHHNLSAPAVRAVMKKCLSGLEIGRSPAFAFRSLTPQQAASKFLAAIGATTKVTVAGGTVVAGRPAYQLVIAPRTSQSLISQIVIAVDSKTYLPLQVQVFARGTSGPAFSVGFTSLSFGKPAASNFTFTPPAGAHVKTQKLAADMPPWAMAGIPAPFPGPFTSQRFLPKGPIRAKLSPTSHRVAIRIVKGHVFVPLRPLCALKRGAGKAGLPKRIAPIKVAPGTRVWCPWVSSVSAQAPMPVGFPGAVPGVGLPGVQVLGSGWLSVAVLDAGNALPTLSPSPAKHPVPGSAPVGGPHPLFAPARAGQAGQILALLRVLLNSAARVHGTWGSGRLLRTNLFSVLITNNGKVLVGAVTPDVLYADAAKVK